MAKRVGVLGFNAGIAMLALGSTPELETIAERSGFRRTGRYDEVVALCSSFERAYPSGVRCREFGTTPEGRPMLALVVSLDGTFDAEAAHKKRRTVVLIQGGIHAGEIDGKDAGFWALRELLAAGKKGPLSRVTLVFVPVFNVDGHERFGPNHRPNQRGPEEMGWRTTAQNLNLNRDYTKADAPETAAMLRLLVEWDPIVYADLHVTDGAKFEHDVAVIVSPSESGPDPLRAIGKKMAAEISKRLTARGHLPLSFYPSFVNDDDPSSGFAVGAAPPRFALGYWSLVNRLSVLVETHSWKEYRARVQATYDTIMELLELAARSGDEWLRAAEESEAIAREIAGAPQTPLRYEHTARSHLIDFRGYEYLREPSAVSGRVRIVYDETRPQTWRVPLFDELKPTLAVRAPKAGYLIPPAYVDSLRWKLELHGIRAELVPEARRAAEVEVFRADEVSFRKESYEGRTQATVKGSWKREKLDIPRGSLFVPINQGRAMLVLHLLEPTAPDSFVSWGFFNACFERKEYIESYVIEEDARAMLMKDPKLKEEFERRLRVEPEFASDGEKRLDFFYRRHPAWDVRVNMVPIYRVDEPPFAPSKR